MRGTQGTKLNVEVARLIVRAVTEGDNLGGPPQMLDQFADRFRLAVRPRPGIQRTVDRLHRVLISSARSATSFFSRLVLAPAAPRRFADLQLLKDLHELARSFSSRSPSLIFLIARLRCMPASLHDRARPSVPITGNTTTRLFRITSRRPHNPIGHMYHIVALY